MVFDSPRVAADCMQRGFRFPMSSCATSVDIRKIVAQRIQQALASITLEAVSPVFGAESCVDPEDFLTSCNLSGLTSGLSDRFTRVVKNMTPLARYKLNKFITDLEYFAFDCIIVNVNPSWEKNRLPEAATCFRTLTIPVYESDEVMATKLSYASCHTEYGHA